MFIQAQRPECVAASFSRYPFVSQFELMLRLGSIDTRNAIPIHDCRRCHRNFSSIYMQ